MVLPHEQSRQVLLVAATLVHAGISVGWAILLAAVLPAQRTLLWAGLAGLGIAALDLGLLARSFPRVRALPAGPQVADHLAFGVAAGAVIARSRRSRVPPGPHEP
jgi:hypothetical protein